MCRMSILRKAHVPCPFFLLVISMSTLKVSHVARFKETLFPVVYVYIPFTRPCVACRLLRNDQVTVSN